uniref:Uncharacterized protein n=1 Tax=Ditylenchus dipsaci TaxID=166011 RepID=A0A915CVZ2_9BILA
MEREENKLTTKRLRRAELQLLETTEELNTMKKAYEELMTNYNAILRLDSKRHRQNIRADGEEIAALVVLKDKLLAKDHEVETQRHKIVELEKKLWKLELV